MVVRPAGGPVQLMVQRLGRTIGRVAPKTLRRDVLRYAITNKTFCIDKAKERLGYKPLFDANEGIRQGVEWTLQNQVHFDVKA